MGLLADGTGKSGIRRTQSGQSLIARKSCSVNAKFCVEYSLEKVHGMACPNTMRTASI